MFRQSLYLRTINLLLHFLATFLSKLFIAGIRLKLKLIVIRQTCLVKKLNNKTKTWTMWIWNNKVATSYKARCACFNCSLFLSSCRRNSIIHSQSTLFVAVKWNPKIRDWAKFSQFKRPLTAGGGIKNRN